MGQRSPTAPKSSNKWGFQSPWIRGANLDDPEALQAQPPWLRTQKGRLPGLQD